MPKRIEYLDVAKGIGILLVVLGHNDFAAFSPFGQQLIYSFHMPLFFFLSGYFTNISLPFREYLNKRFHSVLKPYLFTIFLIYFAAVSFENLTFRTAIVRILKSLYASTYYIDWAQLWFLPHLFVVSLYAFLFLTLVHRLPNRWVRWGLLAATLILALPFLRAFYPYSLSVFGKDYTLYGLPFSLDVTFVSGFFFMLGYEVRQLVSEKTFDNLLLLLGTGTVWLLLNFLFPYELDLSSRVYDSRLVSTAEAILGILFVLALSRQIELHTRRPAALLRYFGNISLVILLFQVPIQEAWAEKLLAVTGHLPLSVLTGFVMGVLGPVLIYELFIRFNPVASFWFGRKAELPPAKETPVEKEQVALTTQDFPAVEVKEQ